MSACNGLLPYLLLTLLTLLLPLYYYYYYYYYCTTYMRACLHLTALHLTALPPAMKKKPNICIRIYAYIRVPHRRSSHYHQASLSLFLSFSVYNIHFHLSANVEVRRPMTTRGNRTLIVSSPSTSLWFSSLTSLSGNADESAPRRRGTTLRAKSAHEMANDICARPKNPACSSLICRRESTFLYRQR